MLKKHLIEMALSTKTPKEKISEEVSKEPSDGLYKRVQTLLDNELYNHAEIMRRLGWEGDDNTNRSKFRKKLYKEKNNDGGVYEFTTDELKKIVSIIDNPNKKG